MDKLNLDNFPEKQRQYILHLKDVMTSQDPARIAEHVELAKAAPSGPGDSEHLEAPATFTLLMYGISGLSALYEIAIQDVLTSGIWDAKEAILSVALRRSSFPLAQIALSQTYLDDEVYKRIAEKVKTTCEDPTAASLAEQLLAKVLQVLLSNPNRHSELGHLIFLESDMISRAATISTAPSLVIELIARNSLALSDEICDAFQKLINDDLDESIYQSFLESHPTLLDPLASSIVERQCYGLN